MFMTQVLLCFHNIVEVEGKFKVVEEKSKVLYRALNDGSMVLTQQETKELESVIHTVEKFHQKPNDSGLIATISKSVDKWLKSIRKLEDYCPNSSVSYLLKF